MHEPFDRLEQRLLVLRCQAGDERALEDLVAIYSPRLRYFLGKLLDGDFHWASDALQEVWIDVHRGVHRLKEPAAFTAWLYRIARDRAARERRRRRLPVLRLDETAEAPVDRASGNGVFSVEEAEWIHSALDKLTSAHREVLVLRFLEEMSYEEIGAVTRLPVGTVRSRLHYAKAALRRIMKAIREEHSE